MGKKNPNMNCCYIFGGVFYKHNQTIICESLKKRNVNLWWRKYKTVCLQEDYVLIDSWNICSANWIFPVLIDDVGLLYYIYIYTHCIYIHTYTLCIIYMLLSSDHPKWITGAFHPLLLAFVFNVVSLWKLTQRSYLNLQYYLPFKYHCAGLSKEHSALECYPFYTLKLFWYK